VTPDSVLRAPASLRTLFWVGVLGLGVYQAIAVRPETGLLFLAGNLVSALALVPLGLWCSGRVVGLPLFPVLAFMYVPTFGLQILDPTDEAARYSVDARLTAAATAGLYLLVATAVWYPLARRAAAPPSYWAFQGRRTSGLFLLFLLLGAGFLLVNNAGWLPPGLPNGAYSVMRSGFMGLAALGATVLAYRAGIRQLSGESRAAFVGVLAVLMLLSAASLSIMAAATMSLMAVAMFALGRGRLPIAAILVMVGVCAVLHAGKHRMREKYWEKGLRLEPADYPAFYADWVAYGVNNLVPGMVDDRRATRSSSLTERTSLLQMLLLVQDKAPRDKPFLAGETYAIIPELMVPRVFLSDKLLSHEGTTILSVHFGRQRREDAKRTTIGFGHLAEAYANFGWAGVVGLAVATGGFLGLVTRWSAGVPVDSFRGLCGLLILGLAIQTEHTMGVTAASLSQGLQLLFLVAVVFMEPKRAGASV
jgi:hypothetical protein